MFILNPYSKNSIRKHLIGYYPFDSDFDDKIAPFVNLTVNGTGSITLSPAVIGNGAFSPAGTNTVLRNSSSPDRNKYSFTDGINDLPFAISVHVKVISVGASGGRVVFGKDAENSSLSGAAEYRIAVSASGDQLYYFKFSEGSGSNYIRYTVNIPNNQWFWLLINDHADGNVDIYINAMPQIKTTLNGGSGFVKFSSLTSGSNIGSFNALGVPVSNRFLEGGLDDLGIFKNYVLTQDDIDWIWNGGNPRPLM